VLLSREDLIFLRQEDDNAELKLDEKIARDNLNADDEDGALRLGCCKDSWNEL